MRVAISNSLAYSRSHPYFLTTSRDFKEKIESALNFLNPIRIDVAGDTLFLGDKDCKKLPFSLELANILHQRKIKSVEFSPGLSVNEIADLLSLLSLQPKEIIKKGGLAGLLKNAGCAHISAIDLDYSGLLGAQGEDAKDIWLYLLKEAVEKKDASKISELADNFSASVKNISVKDIIEDDKLRQDLREFLRQLKDGEKEKLSRCFQEIFGLIARSPDQISFENTERLKEIFKDLNSSDFVDAIISQLSGETNLNTLNLGLFSRLVGEDKAGEIASGLKDKIESRMDLKNNPVLLKRVKELLSGSDEGSISSSYRVALLSLVKDISAGGALFFDRRQLLVSYRLVILNLFLQEDDPVGLNKLLARLDKEIGPASQEKEYGFLKYLSGALSQKRGKADPELSERAEKEISRIVENNIWDEEVSEDLIYLADSLRQSSLGPEAYLGKIFRERKLSACGLKLFLKFFPSHLGIFYGHLKEAHSDLDFLSQIIKILLLIKLPVSLAVLKEIYFSGNELVKIEVLKAMRQNNEFDPEFIFPILKEKSMILRKEALAVLSKEANLRQKGISMLLGIKSFLGMENQLLLENVLIMEELDIREASNYLTYFSRKKFFWNAELRNKSIEVLESWK